MKSRPVTARVPNAHLSPGPQKHFFFFFFLAQSLLLSTPTSFFPDRVSTDDSLHLILMLPENLP